MPANYKKLIGWAVVLAGVFIVVSQVVAGVRKKHPLPDIRHKVYWSKNLYQQALHNKSEYIASELATFYLIERVLAKRDILLEPSLGVLEWNLEEVSRTDVTVSPELAPVSADSWKDLTRHKPLTGKINKRTLYLHVVPNVTTYVFVPGRGETDPLYIVPEYLYRSRAADNSGANLSAP